MTIFKQKIRILYTKNSFHIVPSTFQQDIKYIF